MYMVQTVFVETNSDEGNYSAIDSKQNKGLLKINIALNGCERRGKQRKVIIFLTFQEKSQYFKIQKNLSTSTIQYLNFETDYFVFERALSLKALISNEKQRSPCTIRIS